MRVRNVLAALPLILFASSSFAQQAAAPPAAPTASAQPAAPASAAPAAGSATAAANRVVCEVSNHQGEVVPLRQCVSADEATRRRLQEQESFREFQQQSMMMQPH